MMVAVLVLLGEEIKCQCSNSQGRERVPQEGGQGAGRLDSELPQGK